MWPTKNIKKSQINRSIHASLLNYLEADGIEADDLYGTKHNSQGVGIRYGCMPTKHKAEKDLDLTPLSFPPDLDLESFCLKPAQRPRRCKEDEFVTIVVDNKIRSRKEFLSHVKNHRDQNPELVARVFDKTPLLERINLCWEIENADQELERSLMAKTTLIATKVNSCCCWHCTL